MKDMSNREFDIFVWGCTGFTGKLLAEYMVSVLGFGENAKIKYAFGGRNCTKMELFMKELAGTLRVLPNDLQDAIDSIPMFVCDNDTTLESQIANSKVCISLAGPYVECGEKVIKMCLDNETHYLDITGELYWVKRMQKKYNQSVAGSKLKFIVCGGFCYSFFDLAVLNLQNHSINETGQPCKSVKQFLGRNYGVGMSGGTLRSISCAFSSMTDEEAKLRSDPYCYCNGSIFISNKDEVIQRNQDQNSPVWNETLNTWTAPNVSGPDSDRFIRLSNEEMGYHYGVDFSINTAIVSHSYLDAVGQTMYTMGTSLFSCKPTRSLMTYMAKESGKGPDVSHVNTDCVLYMTGEGAHKKKYFSTVSVPKSEPYKVTAKITLGCAIALVLDSESLPKSYGISTPANLIGLPAITRCEELGINFEVLQITENKAKEAKPTFSLCSMGA